MRWWICVWCRLAVFAGVPLVTPGCGKDSAKTAAAPDPPTVARKDLFEEVRVTLNGKPMGAAPVELKPGADVTVHAQIRSGDKVGILTLVQVHFLKDGPDERPRIVRDWPPVLEPETRDGVTEVEFTVKAPDQPGEYELRIRVAASELNEPEPAFVGKVTVEP